MSSRHLIERWFRRLRSNRRNRCRACGIRDSLQWAHRRPTALSGMGRGRESRYWDIRKNPRAYVLLCVRCHRQFDSGVLLRPSHGLGWRCGVSEGVRDRQIEYQTRRDEYYRYPETVAETVE